MYGCNSSRCDHGNGVYSLVYFLLASPIGRLVASEAIRQSALKSSRPQMGREHLFNVLKDAHRVAWFFCNFGSNRIFAHRKIPSFFQYSRANTYPLHYHAEQCPNPESRVVLASGRDELGMPRLKIDFRFSEADVRSVVNAHRVLDRELRRQQVGRIEYLYDSLEEAVWAQAEDGYHQAGTTRMAYSAETGVVDVNCRVFGTDNLYISSGSCLPTSGQANTTCAIVCLSLRLADHLRSIRASE